MLLTVQPAVVRWRSTVLQMPSRAAVVVAATDATNATAGCGGDRRGRQMLPTPELAMQLRGFGRVQAQRLHAQVQLLAAWRVRCCRRGSQLFTVVVVVEVVVKQIVLLLLLDVCCGGGCCRGCCCVGH